MVTSALEWGVTCITQGVLLPLSIRSDLVTVPPVTVKARSLRVLALRAGCGPSPNGSSKVNVVCPSWDSGVAWMLAVSVPVSLIASRPVSKKGWMRTRAFTFGAAILESDPDERLRAILQRWVGQFEGDPFADASSKGVRARSIDHADAVGQVERLTALLTDVISDIRSLGGR